MSGLGHKRTFWPAFAMLCFTPKSGHVQCNSVCPLCANSVQTVMPASRPSCSSLNDHSWNGWSCFWLIQSFKRATMKHALREIHICCAQYLRSELQV